MQMKQDSCANHALENAIVKLLEMGETRQINKLHLEQMEEQQHIIKEASSLKDQGNYCFVSGNFGDATEFYEKAILLLFPNFPNYEERVTHKPYNFERKSPNLDNKNENTPNNNEEKIPSEQIAEKNSLSEEVPSHYHSLLSVILGNKAACYSSLNLFEQSVKYCTYALELDPKYTKALIRRAKAYEALDKLREALAGKANYNLK